VKKLTHDEIAVRRLKITEIADGRRLPVVALLDNIRSLYNVGSIFRTADGVLLRKLLLAGFTPHPPRKEIEKTALGATLSVPWEYFPTALQAVKSVKSQGYKTCCLELTQQSVPYYAVRRADFPLCLVIGNEINGVSKDVMDQCDLAFEIPMFGTKQSLNVAVAFGIATFELSRIWRDSQSKALV
jgi:23S rRNA (guanosine2251-2'-O)-methyltransferase